MKNIKKLDFVSPVVRPPQEFHSIWKMYFDGSYSKEGVGGVIILISPKKE
jgi:hypothetical protein